MNLIDPSLVSATIYSFRAQLADTVAQNSLHESNWGSEKWKIWENIPITQDILDDAFEQHALISKTFPNIGLLVQRTCKSLPRVQKKITEQRVGKENYFKVLSDFVAIRIHCELSEIQEKIDQIRDKVLQRGGQLQIRGSSNERPYGFFWDEKKYQDITQYVYVFLKEVGYPIEFQIGHQFATHTFTIDSALRDNPKCGKVDLWTDSFYQDVKKYILDKANREELSSRQALQAKAEAIHKNKVPQDLQQILNEL